MSAALLPAAQAFLDYEGMHAPDFSRSRVIIPHHHAGQAFRRALHAALPGRVLLPPRILTLPELAATAASPATSPEADSTRIAELQQVLQQTSLLPKRSLWPAARELLALLDALDLAHANLSAATLRRALYADSGNRFLSMEAGITERIWQAFSQARPGRMRAYAQNLTNAAKQADGPLYHFGLMGLTTVENSCLSAWAQQHPVRALPVPPPHAVRAAWLDAVWRRDIPALAERILSWREEQGPPPQHIDILAAGSLENAARSAAERVIDWVRAGKREIAVIALDRLLARRLRALLERQNILLQDETGWAFSTSAVSHVLHRWLALAQGRIWREDLLDLLKSPFILPGQGAPHAAHELENALRRHEAPGDWAGYLALTRAEHLPQAESVLRQLETARQLLGRGRQSLSTWQDALLRSLQALQATDTLAADPIGAQLLALLQRLQVDSQPLHAAFSFKDWRQWLLLHLEQEMFSDTGVESPVRLTHLAAAHHRELDAALLLGASAAHLPGLPRLRLFNNATLRQLGLPDAAAQADIAQAQLADLLARTDAVTFVWQAEAQGNPTPLSPWLTHLEAAQRIATGEGLITPWQARADTGSAPPPARMTTFPPSAPVMPDALSVSAWQSLVNCPYQFFARQLLELDAQEDLFDEIDKAEYGSLVHQILARFHAESPDLSDVEAAAARLSALSQTAFAPLCQSNYLANAWLQRWLRRIPPYLAWAAAHAGEGWLFEAAEHTLQTEIACEACPPVRIHGRADRIDTQSGQRAVLDYKTQSRETLKRKLGAEGEDVQLALYAWLAGADTAGFVNVDDDAVTWLRPAGDLAQRSAAEAERLQTTLRDLAAGMPLPAQGTPETCAHCAMHGLCRRAHDESAMT